MRAGWERMVPGATWLFLLAWRARERVASVVVLLRSCCLPVVPLPSYHHAHHLSNALHKRPTGSPHSSVSSSPCRANRRRLTCPVLRLLVFERFHHHRDYNASPQQQQTSMRAALLHGGSTHSMTPPDKYNMAYGRFRQGGERCAILAAVGVSCRPSLSNPTNCLLLPCYAILCACVPAGSGKSGHVKKRLACF